MLLCKKEDNQRWLFHVILPIIATTKGISMNNKIVLMIGYSMLDRVGRLC